MLLGKGVSLVCGGLSAGLVAPVPAFTVGRLRAVPTRSRGARCWPGCPGHAAEGCDCIAVQRAVLIV